MKMPDPLLLTFQIINALLEKEVVTTKQAKEMIFESFRSGVNEEDRNAFIDAVVVQTDTDKAVSE